MSLRDLDAVFFVQQQPHVELRDGLFHVCYEIGKSARLEVVLRPSIFLKALRAANIASDRFHEGASVVAFPEPRPSPASKHS